MNTKTPDKLSIIIIEKISCIPQLILKKMCDFNLCWWRWQPLFLFFFFFSFPSSSTSFRLLSDVSTSGSHYPTHFEETFQIVYLTDGHYHQYKCLECRPQNDTWICAFVNSTMEFIANTHILLFVLHRCQATAQFANLKMAGNSMKSTIQTGWME